MASEFPLGWSTLAALQRTRQSTENLELKFMHKSSEKVDWSEILQNKCTNVQTYVYIICLVN